MRFNEAWRVKSGELQKLIEHTAFAVSTEESRPILNGVLWELRDERMRMVATNGHRLAKMELPVAGTHGAGERSDRAAQGARADPPTVSRRRGARDRARRQPPRLPLAVHRGVHAPHRRAVSELRAGDSEGQRSSYALADKAALTSALKRMSVIASDQTHRIKLSFNAGMLKFSVTTPDLGEAQDELPIRYTATARHRLQRDVPARDPALHADGRGEAHVQGAGTRRDDRAGRVGRAAKYLCLVMPLRLMD